MQIQPVEPGNPLVPAVHRVGQAAVQEDHPWLPMEAERAFEALLTHGWDGSPLRCFADLAGGQVRTFGGDWPSATSPGPGCGGDHP
ncbi:MAG: hypothetical protein ACK5KU_06195 [Beutenbergiaceae bacterium]